MELGLRGKRALITAASRGLGRASALALAAEGVSIAAAGRSPSAMAPLIDELLAAGAPQAHAIEIDLARRETLQTGVDQAAALLGGLDIFVANTGGPEAGSFLSLTREDWQGALDESLLPLVDLCHAVLPGMRRQRWGRIIFVTTVGVKVVQPNMVLSDSIRLAIVGMAKSLSIEFAAEGVMVNSLCPGPFATDRMEYLVKSSMERDGLDRAAAEALWLSEVPVGSFGAPEDFGAFVAMLASERAAFVSGTALALDGGKSRAY